MNTSSFFHPEEYLLGFMKNIIGQGDCAQSVLIECPNHHSIVLNCHDKSVYTDMGDEKLSLYGNFPLYSVVRNQKAVTENYISTRLGSPGFRKFSIQGFLWNLGWRTAENCLPYGARPDKPFCLYQWPNLTRLTLMPHALRICTLAVKCSHSLDDIAQRLHIPREDVFNFYRVTHAIGIAGQARPYTLLGPAKMPSRSPYKRIFTAILRRLGGMR